jgi:hypothetical protein
LVNNEYIFRGRAQSLEVVHALVPGTHGIGIAIRLGSRHDRNVNWTPNCFQQRAIGALTSLPKLVASTQA